MILGEMEGELARSGSNGFVYPDYEGHSIANIPSTICRLLGVKGTGKPLDDSLYRKILDKGKFRKVILFVVDGLGYRMWLGSGKEDGFFSKVARNGVLAPITSIFPSTTAAAITTLSTGLTPQEHALPEWIVYFDELKTTINTLPFSPVNDREKGLIARGADPRMLYNGETLYQRLKRNGIESFTFTQKSIIDSAYNGMIKKGSTSVPYLKPSDAAIRLREALESARGKTYLNFYIDTIDSVTHMYGPSTEESNAEIANVSYVLDRNLLGKVDRSVAKETLAIVTADHGHIGMEPDRIIYLNGDRKLEAMFSRNSKGEIIPPTGSPRDVFLHIREEMIGEALSYLTKKFGKVAKIMRTDDAIRLGLFGKGAINGKFRSRVGNVLMLPYGNSGIWYEHVAGKRFKLIGMHGGMSPDEMLVPFGAARLSDLI